MTIIFVSDSKFPLLDSVKKNEAKKLWEVRSLFLNHKVKEENLLELEIEYQYYWEGSDDLLIPAGKNFRDTDGNMSIKSSKFNLYFLAEIKERS